MSQAGWWVVADRRKDTRGNRGAMSCGAFVHVPMTRRPCSRQMLASSWLSHLSVAEQLGSRCSRGAHLPRGAFTSFSEQDSAPALVTPLAAMRARAGIDAGQAAETDHASAHRRFKRQISHGEPEVGAVQAGPYGAASDDGEMSSPAYMEEMPFFGKNGERLSTKDWLALNNAYPKRGHRPFDENHVTSTSVSPLSSFRGAAYSKNRARSRHAVAENDDNSDRVPALTRVLHGDDSEVRSALAEIASGNVTVNIDQFNDVLSTLGRHRKVRAALGLLRIAERSKFASVIGGQRTVKTFTIMIDIYGKARQLHKAFDVFQSMKEQGFEPNHVTYNALVAACARNCEPDMAFRVFEEMQAKNVEPDKFTFASLIDAYGKRGEVERAFEVSAWMDMKGIAKDQTIYSALMDACGRVHQLDRAVRVFEEMKRKGIWPNLITFAVLIDTCANAREPYKAFELFSEIKYWDLEPNVVTYTALIDACAKAGWPERAEFVLAKMRDCGVEPNEITYGALIDAWARARRLDRAFDAVARMETDDAIAPNSVLIGALIEACRRLQDGTRVADVWRLIMKHNIRPARIHYALMISMAAEAGDAETAISVAGHGFARGLYRKSSCRPDDLFLRDLTKAVNVLRSAINECSDSQKVMRMNARLRPILDVMGMDDR